MSLHEDVEIKKEKELSYILKHKEFITYCKKNEINPYNTNVWVTNIKVDKNLEYFSNICAIEGIIRDVNRAYYSNQMIIDLNGNPESSVDFHTNTSIHVFITEIEAVQKAIEQLEEIINLYNLREDSEASSSKFELKERILGELSKLKSRIDF